MIPTGPYKSPPSTFYTPDPYYLRPDMALHAVCLQHAPFEGPGVFAYHLHSRGIELTRYLVPKDGLPSHSGDLLIVMGGPMSANDPEGWIEQETSFIKRTIQEGTAVLGICLGSQLMAKALGAQVRPGPGLEIGMTPITLTDEGKQDPVFKNFPHQFPVFEWHEEVFTHPSGAVALASSELVPIQAFRYGALAYGLLFHLEMEQSGIQAISRECSQDIMRAGLTPSSILENAALHLPQLHVWADQLIGYLVVQNR